MVLKFENSDAKNCMETKPNENLFENKSSDNVYMQQTSYTMWMLSSFFFSFYQIRHRALCVSAWAI